MKNFRWAFIGWALFSVLLSLAGCGTIGNGQNPGSAANAASQTATACSGPGHRQLDFWVGDWDLSWQGSSGEMQTGHNRITRSELGDCVIIEHFDGAPSIAMQGLSVSVYDPRSDRWRQTWVDNQGGYIALAGGLDDDGRFALQTPATDDARPAFRMIWRAVEADSLRWHWQQQDSHSGDWQDRWVINYRRKSAPRASASD